MTPTVVVFACPKETQVLSARHSRHADHLSNGIPPGSVPNAHLERMHRQGLDADHALVADLALEVLALLVGDERRLVLLRGWGGVAGPQPWAVRTRL